MATKLLQQFIREECTPYVRGLLEEALASAAGSVKFEFNRFEITLARDEDSVLVEDVLDATDAGAERVPMSVFADALRGQPA
jgi:hypothetical protein